MTLAELAQNIPRIQAEYSLQDVNFDTECLYDLGDLSALLRRIVDECLPELPLRIQEKFSADKTEFIATVATDKASVVFTAPVDDDWLPGQFLSSWKACRRPLARTRSFTASIRPSA